jgi:hypothetical protein
MGRTTVIQYETRPEAADENQRLVERVFEELGAVAPDGLRYAAFRLADGVTFVHVMDAEGEADPLTGLASFAEFQAGARDRMAGAPARAGATLVGSYRFLAC